jgi:hypothetical protein
MKPRMERTGTNVQQIAHTRCFIRQLNFEFLAVPLRFVIFV